jgi:L,D-peptidoglycan transpeptidase YkuD (ErfK/YbiS/YcfS/YnhG family)
VRRKPNLSQKRLEKTQKRSILRILAASDAVSTGTLSYGNLHFPVALGRNGVRALKREGDGATPLGYWPLKRIYYRRDRIARPRTLLSAEPIGRHSGWCDAAGDRNYNRKVALPYSASAEHLWRNDQLYDVIVVLGYNTAPRATGRGSAIFIHIARRSFAPTAGCIAMKREHLLRLLALLKRETVIATGNSLKISSVAGAGSDKGRSPAFRARVSWRRL